MGRWGGRLLPLLFLALLLFIIIPHAFADDNSPGTAVQTNRSSISPVINSLTEFLSFYEPTYFIAGSYPGVEFQFSIKSRIYFSTNHPLWPLDDLYFGYTQTSFWDLFSSSPSFFDTSYKPSGFFYFQDVYHDPDAKWFRLDLQGGLEHESNGRGGTDERSMNTLYGQPTFTFFAPDGWQVALRPRAWVYVFGVSDNNPDIAKFHGYVDLLTKITWTENDRLAWNDRFEVATMAHVGSEGNHGSVTVDLSFSLRPYIGFTPRIHAQYFAGYEQTLRQYNQISHGYRIGISLFD